jgi:hypothetical protein
MSEPQCPIGPKAPDTSGIETVEMAGEVSFDQAMARAKEEARKRFDDCMLVSWYDRDRDFESPPNTTERADGGPKDGYIHYAASHGARLRVDFGRGRFVFFFAPVEW